MSTEELKAHARAFFEAVWNKQNVSAIDSVLTADFVNHDPNFPRVTDFAAYKQYCAAVFAGYPDVHLTIEDQIAEGEKVVTRYTLEGTNTGQRVTDHAAPTGKRIKTTGVFISRFRGDKIAESWAETDMVGLLRQLGDIPASS